VNGILGSFIAACSAVLAGQGNLLLSLFAAGLVGGFGHCAGMCGPFVLAQTGARLASIPPERMGELGRLAGAALLPYQAGRLVTYSLLGAAAGALAGGLGALPGLRWLGAALLLLAALLFLGYGFTALKAWLPLPAAAGGLGDALGGGLARLAGPLLARPAGWRGFGLGLALGFLPCGLLYGALAAAAAGGTALAGGLGMAAFALGTVPGLVAVAYLGRLALGRFRTALAPFTGALMAANAAILVWFAWRAVA
jgi:hypothetical protein